VAFNNLAFDQYKVIFDGDTQYLPANNDFTVTTNQETDFNLLLHDRKSTSAII